MDHHPVRSALYEEAHHRPPLPIKPNGRCSHIVLHTEGLKSEQIFADLAELCRAFDSAPPGKSDRQRIIPITGGRIKWERHTEFISYTVYLSDSSVDRDSAMAFEHLPLEWRKSVRGALLAAVHIDLLATDPGSETGDGKSCFSGRMVAGSTVCDGFARLWSDFELSSDGFSRMVVEDMGLGPNRAGRLVQRLLDIETYRILTLLGFEAAHVVGEQILTFETALQQIEEKMSAEAAVTEDRRVLRDLLALVRRVEDSRSCWSFRYSATRAYADIVERRWRELNEQRIQGAQRLSNFLKRRFRPALDTCGSTDARFKSLAERADRDAALIRTRIDVARQEQSNDMLGAMNRRLHAQFRLQRTVEAISGVAISYYAIAIFGVFARSAPEIGLGVSPTLLTALAAPVIILVVVMILRRFHTELSGLDASQTNQE